MRDKQQSAFVILGGGCAGWSIARELAVRGISCTVLDSYPPSAFASTRNQGWLQSGALYTLAGDYITARFCQDGYRLIRSRYPDVIRSKGSGYFLFYQTSELQQAILRCQNMGIAARPFPIQELKRREPILEGSCLSYAIEVPDMPLDNTRLLQHIANEACQNGAAFYPIADLPSLQPEWNGKNWRIPLDQKQAIVCNGIILTCGAYIPEMLETLIPGQAPDFQRSKNPVLVLHGKVASSLLITLDQPHGPHLVPFIGAAGEGATVCFHRTDETIAGYQDESVAPDFLEIGAEALSDFYDGLQTLVRQGKRIQAHTYACQKLSLKSAIHDNGTTRGPVMLSYSLSSNAQKSLFVFYPGKFTSALIAAQEFAHELAQSQGDLQRTSMVRRRAKAPVIARQRYYDRPEYILTSKNNKLFFQRM